MITISELVKEKINKNKKYYEQELSYKLKNNSLPILMQDLPGLALLGKIALECEPSILKIKSNEDIYLTILAIIFNYSLNDLRQIDLGFLLDHEKFFKKLENVFIFLLNYHDEAFKYKKGIKKSKLIDFVKIIQKYIDSNYTEKEFFDSITSGHSDICITFQELDRLKTYINLLQENNYENLLK